ncbi:hypothetical protein [Acetobacter orleanensis]|uniref:Uncharacterized protein n=1 Tax=Acetobacter orleanensis TaxID=104099 RepID=A0A4Y3TLB0_9PROT|nr:hypothetical protein [Acetobacter orleanensis]KXV62384.1 hypothetical protein AD949_11565 [Acetobacter orleanensis]PCD79397.1 hypothetical protein CO710_07045 [Acetobacter orleanensis]GAN67617.1 hypothetical protein Abol_009_063 [Acetobacter orleanensis JCM 7639]GBR25253.1 hypothetical protein AA0473_0848 [Acetobacter orleanensis NRIC 0473]GEB82523.1 hypothetical protein AOR01nite_10000 [Acetobacter orleanensis]
MAEENWTEESPEDAEADARADQIFQQTGIAEPAEPKGSFLLTVVLPVLIAGVLLIAGLWTFSSWLGI